MTVDEKNPPPRRRKEPAPHVIEGSAKVIAEDPVPAAAADAQHSAPDATSPGVDPPLHAEAPAESLQDFARSPSSSSDGSSGDDSSPGGTAEAVRPRRRYRWSLYAASGILLGAVTAAIAWFGAFGSGGQVSAVDARVSALASKFGSLEPSIAALDERLSASELSIRQIKEAAASEAKKLAEISDNLANASDAARTASTASQAAQADATRAVTMSQQHAGETGTNAANLKPLQDRLARIESDLSRPKIEGKATADRAGSDDATNPLDHAAALAVVAQTLIQAIDRGDPFPRQMAAIDALHADPGAVSALKPLAESGVPSMLILSHQFAALAAPMAASGSESKRSESFFGRIWFGMTRLIRIRPLGASSGQGPGELVGRIEARLESSDAVGALALWEKLPENAKSTSQKWADELKSRVEAEAAANAILMGAIGNLGKPKS